MMKTEAKRNLEQYVDHDVVDQRGNKVGTLQCLWADQRGEPAYLGVQTGWLFGKTHVVPADTAEVNEQRHVIRLPYDERTIKDAPAYDPGVELNASTEQEVRTYYNVPTASAHSAGQETSRTKSPARPAGQESATVQLHEEELKVGKRQVESGGIRLRKVIRTEIVNRPVELQREEIVVERVPSGEQTTSRSGSQGFQQEEIFIPLRREEAVIQKESRVREEVRVSKKAQTERQTVSEQVRREDVEIEGGRTAGPGQMPAEPKRGRGRPPSTARTTATESQGLKRSVFGLFRNEQQAAPAVDNLKRAGFTKDDISVLFPDKSGTRDFAHEKHTKAPEAAVTGAGTGGILGGAFGWLAGIGALAIPGIGPFVAAGPIMAALSGAAVGATAGGIAGALVGMGIPEYEAKRYEGKVKEGNLLISVHCNSTDNADKAKEILSSAGAEDISSTGERSVREDRTSSSRK